jgi:hypothetical protein
MSSAIELDTIEHADGTVEHWLSEEERLLVQRFDPVPQERSDTIGFFIAKFEKAKPA